MPLRFARRMEVVRASDIRELLKLTARAEVISFAGGLPAPELFPVDELAAASTRVLQEQGRKALQYSTTEGHPRLREQIAERMNLWWGTAYAPEQVLVTAGSQQGLDLVGKLFLDEGDEVFCESPTYIGALSAWNVFKPKWVEVATDEQGMLPEALEQKLRSAQRPKLIYVIPNFQNPSGRTWSRERRRAVVEVATRHGVPVVEDNPYGELRFEGEPLPSMKAFDREGMVINLGTFSKVFCPGLRLAWVAADEALVAKLVILKQGADLHTATFTQMLLADYLDRCDIDANVERLRLLYRSRRDAMAAELERELPAGARFTRPQGGLFLWLELPEGIDARVLLARCLERGVAFVAGGSFFPNGGHANTARLNYSCMPEERIREGVRRLAATLREVMAETARAVPAAMPLAAASAGA